MAVAPARVRLDHLNEPGLVRCDAVPVEEPLQIGEQKVPLAGSLPNAAIHGVQPPS
jgi:hypothetical protein